MVREDMAGVVERLDAVTRIQAGVINDLFRLLGQYVAAEELDRLPVVNRINEAAAIRAEIEKEGNHALQD